MRAPVALTALRAVRFGLGGVAWLAPHTTSRLMRLDPPETASGAYLMRLFGVRDALMGVELTRFGDADRLRRQLRLGIVVDLVDVTASLVSGFQRQARPVGVAYRCVAGLVGASLGLASLRRVPPS